MRISHFSVSVRRLLGYLCTEITRARLAACITRPSLFARSDL